MATLNPLDDIVHSSGDDMATGAQDPETTSTPSKDVIVEVTDSAYYAIHRYFVELLVLSKDFETTSAAGLPPEFEDALRIFQEAGKPFTSSRFRYHDEICQVLARHSDVRQDVWFFLDQLTRALHQVYDLVNASSIYGLEETKRRAEIARRRLVRMLGDEPPYDGHNDYRDTEPDSQNAEPTFDDTLAAVHNHVMGLGQALWVADYFND
ncbi:hypothetical protein QBC47DRAFT_370855 [Echria macrotheca]|uniref:Uncharacterized protein n=1 Tax=Echria macrotheca TaxID=438768 RepID=A0AAJ0F9E5_9PEZI|nr:hypothetical protein QBC47DRAFT_370855 [Echria macrotheca]